MLNSLMNYVEPYSEQFTVPESFPISLDSLSECFDIQNEYFPPRKRIFYFALLSFLRNKRIVLLAPIIFSETKTKPNCSIER